MHVAAVMVLWAAQVSPPANAPPPLVTPPPADTPPASAAPPATPPPTKPAPAAATGIPFLDNLLKDLPQEEPAEPEPYFPPLQPGQPRPIVRFVFEYTNPLNAHFAEKTLRTMLHSRLGAPVDGPLLDEDAAYMADQHRIRGYLRTRVKWALEAQENGDIVTFSISPGPRAKLTRVEVHGNTKVPDELLVAGMKHAPAGLWVKLIGFNPLDVLKKDSSGFYNPIYLEEDTRTLLHNYELEGFFDAKVNGTLASAVRNDKQFLKLAGVGGSNTEEVWLSFEVSEGPQYRFGTITIDGDLPLSHRDLRNVMDVKPGDPARLRELELGLERALDVWRNRGHQSARYTVEKSVRRSLRKVDVTARIEAGPLMRIGNINIKHQNPIFFLPDTRNHVIRRDLAFTHGHVFNQDVLRRSEERLLFTGLFSKVTITPVPTDKPDVVDIDVDVVEQPSILFNLAPAWVPGEGPVGFLLMGSRNILGLGWQANFAGILSPRRFTMNLDANEPRVLNSRLSLGFNVHRNRLVYPEFAQVRTGGAVSVGYPLFDRLYFNSTFGAELVTLDANGSSRVEEFANGPLFPDNKRRNTTRFDVVYDQRDNALFPTRGFLLAASGEYGGPLLLGEVPFVTLSGNARFYVPVFRGLVLKNNTSVAAVFNPGGGRVAATERFYEGGPFGSVRGYGYQSISPETYVASRADPQRPAVGLRVGGVSRLVNNLEVELPAFNITADIPLKVYGFVDCGNTWSESERPFFLPGTLEAKRDNVYLPLGMFWGTGVGAMVVTPLFPMRMEVAVPLPVTRRNRDDAIPVPFLSVGSSF